MFSSSLQTRTAVVQLPSLLSSLECLSQVQCELCRIFIIRTCIFIYPECTSSVGGSGKVDVSELTWEQREKVLRYLFARMNSPSAAANEALARIAMQPPGVGAADGEATGAENALAVLPPIAASPTATAALEFGSATGGDSSSQTQPQPQ